MRILKSKWFQKFAQKEEIPDSVLVEAVNRAEQGLIDADLGGGIIKQRISRLGSGKSKGYRTVLVFRKGHIAFFIFGFSKSRRSNLTRNEEVEFKRSAFYLVALTAEEIDELVLKGIAFEVL